MNKQKIRMCIPNEYRKKGYNIKFNQGLIKPRDIVENKIFNQIDRLYIQEMNRRLNNNLDDIGENCIQLLNDDHIN